MKQILLKYWFFTFFIIPLFLFAEGEHHEDAPPERLLLGWEYRHGDFDENGIAIEDWFADWKSGWNEAHCLRYSARGHDGHYIWYRLTLPETRYTDAALFLPPVLTAFELYIDQEMIYRYGEFQPGTKNKFAGIVSDLIAQTSNYNA